MSEFNLAQFNLAKMKYSLDSFKMSGFVNNLERINNLAEDAPGYIWRSQAANDNIVVEKLFGPDTVANMSVWSDMESLHNYVYRTDHSKVMSRRKEWFERIDSVYSVLWWIPKYHKPTFIEANEKLKQ